MMPNKSKPSIAAPVIASIIAAILVSFITLYVFKMVVPASSGAATQTEKMTSDYNYNRILESKKIRAAYITYPPGCIVDPKSGQISGIFVDILKEIAKNGVLEVEFTEEVAWGTMIQGFDNDRYDIICSPVWGNTVRGKIATLSKPAYYSSIGIWVRTDETRYTKDNNWASINSPEARIVGIDGSITLTLPKAIFPNAKITSYPDLTDPAQLFLDVASNKADIILAEVEKGMQYQKNNPGKVKNIAAQNPLKVFPNIYLMRKQEYQLKSMIDAGIEELQNSGAIEKILRKYEPDLNAYARVARPYHAIAE